MRVASAAQVRRVEHHQTEGFVRERHGPEIHIQVGRDVEGSAIAQRVLFAANVAEQGALILAVEPHHATTAAGIENGGLKHA